jgi:hypothetical protein
MCLSILSNSIASGRPLQAGVCILTSDELKPRFVTKKVQYIGSLAGFTYPHHLVMLTDQRVLLFGPLLFSLFLLHRFQRVKQIWQAFEDLPTYTIGVSPLNPLSRLLPRIPWISGGINFSWENVYERQPLPGLQLSYTAHSHI